MQLLDRCLLTRINMPMHFIMRLALGKTVSSEEMYSVAVPYLISVDSSQDVESPDYMDVKVLPYDEVLQKLTKADKSGNLAKTDKSQNIKILKSSLKITKHTENGFVQEITAKDNKWTGEEWKKIFALNSTNFYLENYNGKLRMVTVGKRSRYGNEPLRGKCVGGETDYGSNDIIVLLSRNEGCNS